MENQSEKNQETLNQTKKLPSLPLQAYAETNLPTEFGLFKVVVFQEEGGKEHLAICHGDLQSKSNVLVRIHSECLTGEVFHSLKCDCKDQLHLALQMITKSERGMVIYLRQEGRGIGLGNKIKAYALQEQGHDTVDANRILGFEDDLRDYSVAAQILEHFKISSIQLLTNNPEKMKQMDELNVKVLQRVSILCEPNQHSFDYLKTKQERMGHLSTEK